MVTSIYAAILGLMLMGLSINVIRARRKYRAGLGDANNLQVVRRVRAQANFSEYAPMLFMSVYLNNKSF